MPATYLTFNQKVTAQHKLVTRRCRGLLAEKNITQKEVAQVANVAEMTVSNQLNNGKLSLQVLIAILMLTEADQDELAQIMSMRR